MAAFKSRKKQLQSELEFLESGFRDRYSKAKINAFGSIDPVKKIRSNPLKAIGAAVLVGLAAGIAVPKRKSKKKSENSGASAPSGGLGFSSLLLDEVKRIAAKKAAHYVSDMVDKKIKSE